MGTFQPPGELRTTIVTAHTGSTLFWDVDTQVDFMDPSGALYVPQAEEIVESLAALTSAADRFSLPVLASADDHEEIDAEISLTPDFDRTFPPHCMRGTPGAARVPETSQTWTLELSHEPVPDEALAAAARAAAPRVLVHKKQLDVFSNPNVDRLLEELNPARVVVYGVALDFCNKAAVEGLLARQVPHITVLTDATRPISAEDGRRLLDEWRRGGVELTTTTDLLAELEARGSQ